MILNISDATAEVLLATVNDVAADIRKEIGRRRRPTPDIHNSIVVLQHLGILKHRLEYALCIEPCFQGPADWGFPLHGRPPAPLIED